MPDLPYRDFYYPLNVFMYILTHEEGAVPYLHYGLFESPDETIGAAQERSTEMLLARLPAPPATVLEAGIGVGTTLARLTAQGYQATGITPDLQQVAMVRAKYGDHLQVYGSAFETFETAATFDSVIFQESAQYIDAAALFGRARDLTRHVIVLDEFTVAPDNAPGPLHSLERFLTCADMNGFQRTEDIDLSTQAAPTIDYFMRRLPRYRDRLVSELSLTPRQVDDLIESGAKYRDMYRSGIYGYRLLVFRS